ncbi:MAG: hypothetical protein J0I79_09475 [Mesorhizobium sp.]|uniref:hypothetical protein n=1 Tax=Mesorhizobium sp. TaxID=1871066 RepID=UPI001AC6BAB8|nr:hypothetical protein [Mesorhizobium sp.]MBN9218170.1 hypothetical protein [Mesorhizobium sp.]
MLLLETEYRDFVVGIVMFCALGLAPLMFAAMRQPGPIVGTQQVEGSVEYVTTMPLNPKIAVGQGFHYRYEVRLQDTAELVFVDGEIETPHVIGSTVWVERQHHRSGADTYRLLNG